MDVERYRSFPYREATLEVTRLPHRWRIAVGPSTAEGLTLVDAFEAMLGRHIGDEELIVVLAALRWDRSLSE